MSFKETEVGKIPLEWKVKSIAQSLYIKGRIGWKGLKKSEYIEESKYRIINGSSLDGKNIDWDKCGYISEERYEESPEIMLEKNDIVMTKDGTIGKIAIINELEMKTTVASGLFVIRVINTDISYKYLYYYFNSRHFKELVKSRIEGSVIPHLYQRDLVELKIPMPAIEEQKAIAKILSDLDEKIETNNKINKNLEEMAQAIFKQWFVDFEFPNEEGKPYKSSGGELVESELGMIPKGWNIKELGELYEVKGGKRLPKGSNLQEAETNYPYLRVTDVTGGVINKKNLKYISDDTRAKIDKYNINSSDLYISIAGTIGIVGLVNESLDNASLTENMAKIKTSNLDKYFIYLLLNSKIGQEEIISRTVGSTQPKLPLYAIKAIKMIKSDKVIEEKFYNLIKGLFMKREGNQEENERLEKIRDTLLPKLMSGEIRVPLDNVEI